MPRSHNRATMLPEENRRHTEPQRPRQETSTSKGLVPYNDTGNLDLLDFDSSSSDDNGNEG